MKKKTGFISIILSAVMLSRAVPMEIWEAAAEGIQNIVANQEQSAEIDGLIGQFDDRENLGKAYVVEEIVKNRTENTKEFLMSDDRIVVQQFANPVHYYENGNYKEIDNSLIEVEANGRSVYKNKSNSFQVKFNKESTNKKNEIEIEEEGYTFKVSYQSSNDSKVKPTINQGNENKKVDYSGEKHKKPVKYNTQTGRFSYKEIEDNTNFEYQIKNNQLLPSIVIDKKQAQYEYKFELESHNLSFVQNEDGSISVNTKDSQTKFRINAPYIAEANGEYSDEVQYSLQDGKLTIIANAKWINEKASFPITINPSIESVRSKRVDYVNVSEKSMDNARKHIAYSGQKNGYNNDLFLNYKLPKVEAHYQLVGLQVLLDYETHGAELYDSKDYAYDVYVAKSTNNLESIIYEEKPERIQTLEPIKQSLQFSDSTYSYESSYINVTNISSNTITLGVESTSETSDGAYIAMPMSLASGVSTVSWYETVTGIKDDYSLENFQIDGVNAYVNNGTGHLTAILDLAAVNTLSEMPLEAKLVYNDYYNSVLDDFGKTSYVGNHFKLNFQQYMIQEGNVYYLVDADGSISTFYSLGNGNYYSKDKKLYYDSTTEMVSDLVGNEMQFDNGLLKKVVSSNNPTQFIEVNYVSSTSDRISQLGYYENNNLKYTMNFTYNSLGQLSHVQTNVDSNMPFQCALKYNEIGNLIEIRNQIGFSSEASVDDGVKLLTIEYLDGLSINDGILGYIYNNQEGVTFYRDYDKPIEEVRYMAMMNDTTSIRLEEKASFYYKGICTRILYSDNETTTATKYVAFNNVKEVISEWTENGNGIASVQTKNNWKDETAIGNQNYTQETCSFYTQYGRTDNEFSIVPNNQGSKTINSSMLGVTHNDIYKYAVTFEISINETETIINAGLNLVVSIENNYGVALRETLNLAQGGRTYVSIPCAYYPNPMMVTITNLGTENVTISHLSYMVVDRVQESYAYNSDISAHKLSNIKTNLRSGEYFLTSYDNKQRVDETQTKSIESSDTIKTVKYTYGDTARDIAKGKISSIVSTSSDENEDIERIDYNYLGTSAAYRITTTFTKGELKQQNVIERQESHEKVKFIQTDENNQQTTSYYKPINGDMRLFKVEYNNLREEYSYNQLGLLTNLNIYNGTNATAIYSQTERYDENGVYLGTDYAGDSFRYTYDRTGYINDIQYGETNGTLSSMLSYSYNTSADGYVSSNKLSEKLYANGQMETYMYNGTNTTVTHKNSNGTVNGTYTYYLNSFGRVTSQDYKVNGNTNIHYDYGVLDDLEEQQLTIWGNGRTSLEYTNNYDPLTQRLLTSQVYYLGNCRTERIYDTEYNYNTDGQLEKIQFPNDNIYYTYDAMGRLQGKRIEDFGEDVGEEYQYRTYTIDGVAYTTNQLSAITNVNSEQAKDRIRSCEYNENGQVISLSYGGFTYNYTYDELGRLASETNRYGAIKTYTYDSQNNVQKSGLTYTNGKLTAVDGTQIVYDALGNPTTYKGNTFTWEQGRKLVGVGNTIKYAYDGNGMRYQKSVNGTKTHYYYNGSQLLLEVKNEIKMYYMYDQTGVAGIIYDGQSYYFDKNTLGDVIAIRDNGGDIVARYEYDAWGKCTVMSENGNLNTISSFIGNVNPIRYRGYYYDTETGFYYLQTRYYDPTICRFINADNYELVSTLASTPGQLNMYAYCNNNPIMYTDETGEGILTALLIGFLVGATVSAVSQGVTNGWDNINYLQAGVDGAFGALSVGLAATGIGLGASMAFGGGLGFAQYGLDTAISGGQFSWCEAALATTLGVLGGKISGAGAQNAKALANTILRNTSATATGMISGIRALTGNTAFSDTVRKSFEIGARNVNIAMVLNGSVTTLRDLILGD